MYSANVRSLFPSKLSFGLFWIYIFLFVNQGWLVTSSQEPNHDYNYNIYLAVFLTEFIKFSISIVLFSINHPILTLLSEIKSNSKVFRLYFIPASLYCLYNNLSYVNLSHFDPTTYFVVLQLRVAVTGVIFQILFKKQLTKNQWASLFLLTIGCMIKQINFGDVPHRSILGYGSEKKMGMTFSLNTALLLLQVFCSCLAGVYNEYLLKSQGEVNVYVQNIFHNTNSMICILLVFVWNGELHLFTKYSSIRPFLIPRVALVVINNAAIGVVTSFFLKYLNSILKNFASSLELIFTAIIARVLFSIPIYMNTIVSILLIIVATVTYSQNPVVSNKTISINKKDISNSEQV